MKCDSEESATKTESLWLNVAGEPESQSDITIREVNPSMRSTPPEPLQVNQPNLPGIPISAGGLLYCPIAAC